MLFRCKRKIPPWRASCAEHDGTKDYHKKTAVDRRSSSTTSASHHTLPPSQTEVFHGKRSWTHLLQQALASTLWPQRSGVCSSMKLQQPRSWLVRFDTKERERWLRERDQSWGRESEPGRGRDRREDEGLLRTAACRSAHRNSWHHNERGVIGLEMREGRGFSLSLTLIGHYFYFLFFFLGKITLPSLIDWGDPLPLKISRT